MSQNSVFQKKQFKNTKIDRIQMNIGQPPLEVNIEKDDEIPAGAQTKMIASVNS